MWRSMKYFLSIASVALAAVIGHGEAAAKDSGLIFVSNEKSSTITVLDQDNEVTKTIETCARPRSVAFQYPPQGQRAARRGLLARAVSHHR